MPEWERYIRAFRKDLDVWAVWQPGDPVALCDYGTIDTGRWRKLGSLWELVPRDESDIPAESSAMDMTLGSASVSTTEAGISAPTAINASVTLRFSSEGSLYVYAHNTINRTVANLQHVANRISPLGDNWDGKNWYLVVGVRTADSFGVLASSHAGGEINVTATLTEFQTYLLGAAKAGANLHISGSVGFSFIGCSGPIHVDLVRVRRRPWPFGGGVDVHGFGAEQGQEEVILEDIRPSDLSN